jgi:hypothetical protein
MKGNSYMSDLTSDIDFWQWQQDLLSMLDRYRRENEALRLMLVDKGLTRAQIRRGVKRRVESLEPYEEASVLCRRVCEEMRKRIEEDDPVARLAKMQPKKDLKEMS